MTIFKYTFHEDFSGAGMARMGLGSNWKCLRACDINLKKCKAYRENFGGEHLIEGDINNIKISEQRQANLAWASFPCQDTSLAGGYKGLAGDRSGTFWSWYNLVKGMRTAEKPYDIVCLENVRGLLTSNQGTDFAAICEALMQEGYIFGAAIINASLFLPQSRERLFIVGIRGDKSLTEGFASPSPVDLWHPSSMQSAHKHLSEKAKENWFWLNPNMPHVQKPTLDDIFIDEPEGIRWHTKAETSHLVSLMSEENKRKLGKQIKKNKRVIGMLYKRTRQGKQRAEVRFDGVAGCLRTATGGSSRQTVMVVNGNKINSRLLAPREAARLMGLPDGYKLPEKYNEAYNLCGDGVAVSVVRFLAETIFEPVLDRILQEMNSESFAAAE